MTSLRVAFVTMPRLYADILSASLAKHTDLDIVAVIEDRHDLAATLRRLAPDVIFIGLLHGESDATANDALQSSPHSRVIGLAADGRHASLHFLRPQRVALEEADPDRIVSAILDQCLHPTD